MSAGQALRRLPGALDECGARAKQETRLGEAADFVRRMAAKSVRFPALALSRSGSKGISHPQCRLFDRAHCRTPALAAHTIHWLRGGFNRERIGCPGAAAAWRAVRWPVEMAARVAAAWPHGLAGRGEAVQHGALSRNLKKFFAAAVISRDVVRLFGSLNPCFGEMS
ncbi:hypothetical protein C7S13_3531 [Burkholderia cepacia]|nr:hypothetical protein [Burkholderia cepacia]